MSLLGILLEILSPQKPTIYRERGGTKSYCDSGGYLRFNDSNRLVHRYLAERKLGRKLRSWEVVHHIDGNKRNNDQDNLRVCSQEEHERIHEQNLQTYGNWHEPKILHIDKGYLF